MAYYSSFPKKYESFIEKNKIEKSIDIVNILDQNKTNHAPNVKSGNIIVNKEYELDSNDIESNNDVDNAICEDKYLNYLSELSKSRFALIDKHDINILAELMGLGVIPILAHDTKIFDLEENVHYFRNDNMVMISEEEESIMRENCVKYYNNNIKSESVLKLLINHVFVWDF